MEKSMKNNKDLLLWNFVNIGEKTKRDERLEVVEMKISQQYDNYEQLDIHDEDIVVSEDYVEDECFDYGED